MQHFKFVNWWTGGFVFWCHEQVNRLLSRFSDLDMGVAQLFSAVISINLMECFEQNKISFQASPYVQEDGCMSGLSSLGVPGVPCQPQILAHQLTLSQPGGAGQIMPPHYYWHPRIFRPSNGPDPKWNILAFWPGFRLEFLGKHKSLSQ